MSYIIKNESLLEEYDKLKIEERIDEPTDDKCWYDYRILSKSCRTKCFYIYYLDIYQQFYIRHIDITEGSEVFPPFRKPDGDIDDAVKRSLVLARQTADKIGCKYPFFIRTAFKRVEDFGWHYFPTFEDMTAEDAVMDIEAAWHVRMDATLELADSDYFTAKKWENSPIQREYYDYLIGRFKGHPMAKEAFYFLVHRDKIIPLEYAMEHWDGFLAK